MPKTKEKKMAYFDTKTINAVWKKAIIVNGVDPNIWRKDYAGAWIKKSEYGNCKSDFGWEIDHQKPVSKQGTDDLNNLVPLQWENNRSKGDSYPEWSTVVSSYGENYYRITQFWKSC